MGTDFDFDLFNEMVDNAPTAGFGPQVNFGKMTMTVQIIGWKDHKPQIRPFKAGEQLKQGENLQLLFESDMSEFNPALTNLFKRTVDVKESSQDRKTLTDWTEIVKPSVLSVFGKDWHKKLTKGIYCQWQSDETVEVDKDGNKKGYDKKDPVTKELVLDDNGNTIHRTNTTIHFLAVYKSKADCAVAHAERFSKNDTEGNEVSNGEVPEEIISQVRGLVNALGEKEARSIMIATAPYNEFDIDTLITAANPL